MKDISKLLSNLTSVEQVDALLAEAEKALLITRAREFSEDGFEAFYENLFNRPLPPHAKKDWVPGLFKAQETQKGLVIEAARGFTKSTTITIAYTAFYVGHHPYDSNLLIQVGDDIAGDNTQDIANIIAYSPTWKEVFPNVVPDESHWATSGYFVKLSDMEYGAFVEKRSSVTKDPTFVGVGYKSRALIGKHPTGLLISDDLHDENNTASDRELRKVKLILTGTIFPAAQTAKIKVYIGTPWAESDMLHYCLSTGEFDHIKTPAEVEGEPTWPEKFDKEALKRERAQAGEIEYARMYLLDLSKTKGLTLKEDWLGKWSHKDIFDDWTRFIGVDFTSTSDPRKLRGDYFALAVGAVIPGGKGVVLEDGVRARVSQAEAEDLILTWAIRYPTLQTVTIEAIISGNNFYEMLLNNATMRGHGIIPLPGRSNKQKAIRIEKQMAPLFQRRRVYISDKESEFLVAFKDEWMNWQGQSLESTYTNDTLDATYWMIYGAQAFIAPLPESGEVKFTNALYGKPKQKNPFNFNQ